MAKSKAARAALNTKHTTSKKTTARGAKGNRFDGLGVEEPYEYFRFMALPRELRDQVLDDVLTCVEAGNQTAPIMHILVGKNSSRRLTTMRHGSPDCWPRARGALALSLVSKQVQRELEDAVSRVAPHHVRARLCPLMKSGD